MKYSIFRKTIIFCAIMLFCVSKSFCLDLLPWKVFSSIKDVGEKHNSLSVEKLSSEIEYSMKRLRSSLLFSPPEFIDEYISQMWKILVNTLNKYSDEIKEENEQMYLTLLDLVNAKK